MTQPLRSTSISSQETEKLFSALQKLLTVKSLALPKPTLCQQPPDITVISPIMFSAWFWCFRRKMHPVRPGVLLLSSVLPPLKTLFKAKRPVRMPAKGFFTWVNLLSSAITEIIFFAFKSSQLPLTQTLTWAPVPCLYITMGKPQGNSQDMI